MERHILHMDLDTFFVSVERLKDASLIGKPVIVGGMSDRGVVASCSYEARKYGVHSAMPIERARQLCPDAAFVKGDFESYGKYSGMVTDILLEQAPCVEKASIDEHYIDLTGMDRYFGCMKWAGELKDRILRETGLPISYGLSVNKTVSKVATGLAKPNGKLYVEPGKERAFLAPMSLKKIMMIGEKTYLLLRSMGLELIGTIQQTPVEVLVRALGDNGNSIWRKANAIDNRPVVPYCERKSMSCERTFEEDIVDMERLRKTIAKAVDELSFDLRKEGKLAACVAVKIRYSNFDTNTVQARVSYTASGADLTRKALELFNKSKAAGRKIRLVGVKFSDLIYGSQQIDLFNDTVADVNLNLAMDAIRKRFGFDVVKKAITLSQGPLRA